MSKMGVACAGHRRSVGVDVDPCAPQAASQKYHFVIGWLPRVLPARKNRISNVLFCFVWLATLGMPVVAPGTAAGPFRRVVEAPFWVPSSPVVERGALSTEVPPHLKRGEVPGHCRPGHPRSSFGGARAHSPCERTQRRHC